MAMPLQNMGPVVIEPGGWRDLEVVWGRVPDIILQFRAPAGVKIRVRYGYGWLATNRQEQTLDGTTLKELHVSGWVGRARMSAKSTRAVDLTWIRQTPGP
jgi:hypothetical protein